MNFFKKFMMLLALIFSTSTIFSQSPNIVATIEEVVSTLNGAEDQFGYSYYMHQPQLGINITLPETGPGEIIEDLSDIVEISFALQVSNFNSYLIDANDFNFCNYNADGTDIHMDNDGIFHVNTYFSNGMILNEEGESSNFANEDYEVNCSQTTTNIVVVDMIIDAIQAGFDYDNYLQRCFNNKIDLPSLVKISDAYFNLNDGTQVAIIDNEQDYNFQLPFTNAPVTAFLSDFNRTWSHICTENDGSFTVDWDANPNYSELQYRINGELSNVENTASSFSRNNLGTDDYTIIIEPNNACPFELDDINIVDLSHEVTRTWGHTSCGESNGWLQLNWTAKALPNIDISIDGGVNYTTVPASNEVFRVDDIAEGDYDIWVKWSYQPYACTTQLDDINIGVENPANNGLRANYYCDEERLRLREITIDATLYKFQYRLFSDQGWSAWILSANSTNGIRNIYDISSTNTRVQYRVKVYCGENWSGWSTTKTYNFPSCRLNGNKTNNEIIYPNPAKETVNLNFTNTDFEEGEVKILDLSGKTVKSVKLIVPQLNAGLNLSGLNNGLYLVQIITNGEIIHNQKLTIAH